MCSLEVKRDRSELAEALADNIEFISIVTSSAGAVADLRDRNRLILLGGITGTTEEERVSMALEQLKMKSQPWEHVHVIYKLTQIFPKA